MRRILTVAALTGVLMSGAIPAFADGNDTGGGRSTWQGWQQPAGSAPKVEAASRRAFTGGEDQYLVGATRSASWRQPADGTALMAKGRFAVTPVTMDAAFGSQSG